MILDFFEQYDIQKFESDIPTEQFDCGDEDLNDFIKNEVQFYKQQLIAMPYVVVEKDKSDKILAYFTLSNDKIAVTYTRHNFQPLGNTVFSKDNKELTQLYMIL